MTEMDVQHPEIGVQHPEIGVQLPPKPVFNFLRKTQVEIPAKQVVKARIAKQLKDVVEG